MAMYAYLDGDDVGLKIENRIVDQQRDYTEEDKCRSEFYSM